MSLSKEALDNKPKKPLNAYFAFRLQKANEYKDVEKKGEKIKNDWENLDPKVKDKMQGKFHTELAQYKIDYENWAKKYDVQKDDVRKSKSKPKESGKV